ncbi:DUF484 family protein [Aurantivibrio infirmus]
MKNSDNGSSNKNNKTNAVSDRDVRGYLKEHPDFFSHHPDLLEDITIAHDSGEAVSLVERQVSLLRERNIDMRHRLNKLLDNARENDKLFDKTRRLVLTLIEARSLTEIVDGLYGNLDRDFSIPYVSLIIFGDVSRLPSSPARVVSIQEAKQAASRVLSANKIVCGGLPEAELQFLFGEQAKDIGSAALVPLLHGNCFGLFAVGHTDPQHYRSSMGTLFLSHIGDVLNRVIPPHLTN